MENPLFVAWAALGVLLLPAPQEYTVVDLGVLPGGAEAWAFGLNDAGQVAATAQYDEPRRFYHAALWSDGALTDLGQLSTTGFHSFATAVNGLGHVVGGSPQSTGIFGLSDRAFLHDGTGMIDLGALAPGARSFAFDINDEGDVVGRSGTGASFNNKQLEHAVLWSNGNIVDLGTLGGLYSRAHAVNRSLRIVGASLIDDGPLHAFVWSGAMADLRTLGGPSSEAWDINDAGQIVGYAQNEAGLRRAFLFEHDAMRDLGALPGAQASEAYGINAAGQVVGTSWAPRLGPRAVLWEGEAKIDLNDRIGAGSPWRLQVARGINAAGRIVGYGRQGGRTRAFLLTPSKE